ncbi:hypothetical protein [Deinococcus sonorensis]|uniref:Uncharacterized protein n=1 Tax=Deinococcus sonorensis TaxID=309891 RepID=A0ABV8YBJ3_9DEIO
MLVLQAVRALRWGSRPELLRYAPLRASGLSRAQIYAVLDRLLQRGVVVRWGKRKGMHVEQRHAPALREALLEQLVTLVRGGATTPTLMVRRLNIDTSLLAELLSELVQSGQLLLIEGHQGRHRRRVYQATRPPPRLPVKVDALQLARRVLQRAHARGQAVTRAQLQPVLGEQTDPVIHTLLAGGALQVHSQGEHHRTYRYRPDRTRRAPLSRSRRTQPPIHRTSPSPRRVSQPALSLVHPLAPTVQAARSRGPQRTGPLHAPVQRAGAKHTPIMVPTTPLHGSAAQTTSPRGGSFAPSRRASGPGHLHGRAWPASTRNERLFIQPASSPYPLSLSPPSILAPPRCTDAHPTGAGQ